MKRIFAVFLVAALLMAGGCSAVAPAETPAPTPAPTPVPTPMPEPTFKFTRENFPVMDGSTSLVPLGQAVAAVLLGEDTESVSDLIKFNRTTQSYRNLMWDACDIIIAAAAADTVMEEYTQIGFEYDMAKIASDALIFVVNADNPVDNLTTEQLQKIYMGEITNWKEVGGNDVPIIPFQRNAEAGSQTILKNTVMKDLPIMDPPKDYLVDSMMGLMEAVRNFDGSEGAIGYSVYYYANDMKMAEGLKIISVDGVSPEPESIKNEEYPFLASYYATVSASEPEDSPARILWNWLQGEEGGYIMEQLGYVPIV